MGITFVACEEGDESCGSAEKGQPEARPQAPVGETFSESVYEQVACVPVGFVCTYGTIAKLAGYPGASREVGTAMSRVLPEQDLPCHRIVNAKGTLAPDHVFGGMEVQRAMLEAEGVGFLADGTIDMKRYAWPPSEEPLLVQESLF